jgi:hypothetical protein
MAHCSVVTVRHVRTVNLAEDVVDEHPISIFACCPMKDNNVLMATMQMTILPAGEPYVCNVCIGG